MVMPGTLRNKNLCVCLTVKPPHSICLQPYRGIRNVLVFPAQFLVLVVQALVLDVISGGFARFLCRGWESSLLNFSSWMRVLRLLLLLSGSALVVFSLSCTGVVFMSPRMTHRTMFWTWSSLLLLVLAAIPCIVDAYSMIDLTAAV